MKPFLKLVTTILCIMYTLAQTTGALAAVIAKCPDNNLLKNMGTNKEIVDDQGVTWSIDKQGNANGEVMPASFSGWEAAVGLFPAHLFPKKNNGDLSHAPYLNCSVGNFHVAGFLPVDAYKSCYLDGETLYRDNFYKFQAANSSELICA